VVKIREYTLKRGYTPDGERILSILKEFFPVEIEKNDRFFLSYGSFQKLEVWIDSKGRKLCVESVPKRDTDKMSIRDTIKRYNSFLEKATGYTSKERAKLLK
jgi:hypothetical protein